MAYRDKFHKRILDKRKAATIAQVIKDTGRMSLAEAHRRMYPNASEQTHLSNSDDMLNEEVMALLEKILHLTDKDLMKKLRPEVVVQDLLKDLMTLSSIIETNQADPEIQIKAMNAKASKQKLIGLAIGMWRQQLTMSKDENADELIKELGKLGNLTEEI